MGLTQDHLIQDYAGHAAGVFVYFLYGSALGIALDAPLVAHAQKPPAKHPNLMGSQSSGVLANRATIKGC
jgi:hypothetical protein